MIENLKEILITCSTCEYSLEYDNGRQELSLGCFHMSCEKGFLFSHKCLERISSNLPLDKVKHYKYFQFRKLHNIYKYNYWKPRRELLKLKESEKSLSIDSFLGKEVFEI